MNFRYIALLLALGLVVALLVPGVILAQPKIPHTLEGRSACTTCHQIGGAGVGAAGGTGLPASHQGRTDSQCQTCHQAASAAPAAQPTPTTAAPAATATPVTPAASPTAAPAKPAATATATPATLPKTGGFPVAPIVLGSGGFLAALGWSLRRLLKR